MNPKLQIVEARRVRPYDVGRQLELDLVHACITDPSFYAELGHLVQPEGLLHEDARVAMRIVHQAAGEGPTHARAVLARASRLLASQKISRADRDKVLDLIDAFADRKNATVDVVREAWAPILRRREQDRIIEQIITRHGAHKDLDESIERLRATQEIGRGTASSSSWVRASDVEQVEIEWLWERRLPVGSLCLLEGLGGLGKSTIAVDLAARLTTGRPMPDEIRARTPRGVVWISSEESTAAVVVPRLQAAGADLDKVIVRGEEGGRWTSDKGGDELRTLIENNDVGLVVIDALKDHLECDDSEKQVRAALAPLVQVGRFTGACIVGIRHWTKAARGAAARGAGSTAYRDVARSTLQLGQRPDGGGLALAHDKTAYAAKAATLGLDLISPAGGMATVAWGSEIDVTADDIATYDPMDRRRGSTKREEAADVLRSILTAGDLLSEDAKAQVIEEVGCSPRTVQDAARDLVGVEVVRVGQGAAHQVFWRLPTRTTPP